MAKIWSHISIRCFKLVIPVITILQAGITLADAEVRHTVSFPQSREQSIIVRSEFPVTAAVTELLMPNWTPGSYLIREFAANVDRISAHSGVGNDLPIQKISKDRWHVATVGITRLVVDYEVFTPELNVRSSWASNSFSLINGTSVFLYTEPGRNLPQTVAIVTNPERGEVFTAMPSTTGVQTYRAEDYDELVDNPIAVAVAPSYRFETGKQEYMLVNVGENDFWDGEKASDDVEKIVVEIQSFWRSNPLTRPYLFLNFAVEAKGGLEHDYSTVIMTGRRQMQRREDYIKWLSVIAHEFFHVWNVRHLRPAALADYDYQSEQYTRQLWLAEGLTSYYANLMLSRAGLISPEEYMELLAKDIHRLETTPGRTLRPVTEASLDAWIRLYQPNSNSINSNISYYNKGAVIGLVLDAYLREQSKGRHDLDEVMRTMYERFSQQPYTSDDFEQVVLDVGGSDALEFLKPLLETTTDPDVDTALDWFGLKLNRDSVRQKAELEGKPVESGFGVIWDDKQTDPIVKSVLAGSSGAVAGLLPMDELLAIGSERVSKELMQRLMTSFQPGETTTLLISRRGQILTLEVKLENAIPKRFEIVVQSDFAKRHVRRLQTWLGQNLRE